MKNPLEEICRRLQSHDWTPWFDRVGQPGNKYWDRRCLTCDKYEAVDKP